MSHLAGMAGGCASLLARCLDTARTSFMREGEKRSARRIAGVERLAGLMMVIFRVIDRKCVASTGSTWRSGRVCAVVSSLHDRRIRMCT